MADLYRKVDEPFFQGVTICIGDLVMVRRMKKSDEAESFVSFNPELYVWRFENMARVKQIAVTGTLGMPNIEKFNPTLRTRLFAA